MASSSPGVTETGSTPRANRYCASEWMLNARPVWAITNGSNQALSRKASVVSSSQPVDSPPMTPPRPMGRSPPASAMTQSAGDTA